MANQSSFRDNIATVDARGKRIWMFPKKPSGRYFIWRQVLGYFLLVNLFIIPFIKISDYPLFQLDIFERRFSILGQIFFPQDLYLFALVMIIGVLFVVLFTVVFGRLFCGWICPQTIFMELVFRRVEYWIEGSHIKQRKLSKSSWTANKILRKIIKHLIFWIISFIISNLFLSYIIGIEALSRNFLEGPLTHFTSFLSVFIFSSIFYFVFAFLREQVCVTICPYGRLQSVLLDSDSLIVAYDHVRGEQRAPFRKEEDRLSQNKGDCIDCFQCVHVCPTGIDIRNGTQLECIGCTACIDACDEVMDKMKKPRGLVRYASQWGIKNKIPFKLTIRAKAYIFILSLFLLLFSFLIADRNEIKTLVLRTRGTLFQKIDNKTYSNIYDIRIFNRTSKKLPIEIKIIGNKGDIKMIGNPLIQLEPYKQIETKFMILMNVSDLNDSEINLEIGVYNNEQLIETISTTFISSIL